MYEEKAENQFWCIAEKPNPRRKTAYLEGRSKSFTWEEVKPMVHKKEQRKNKAPDQEIALHLPFLNTRHKAGRAGFGKGICI